MDDWYTMDGESIQAKVVLVMKSNNKGAALGVTLMLLAVAAILSAALLSISHAESIQSIREENRIKAFYTARSAADSTAAWLLSPENLKSVTQVVPATQGPANARSGTGTLEEIDFTAAVERDAANYRRVIIRAAAEHRGAAGKAQLTLNEEEVYSSSIVFDNAIFAHGNVTLTGNTEVQGGVEAGGTVSASNNVTLVPSTPIEHSTRTYPMWTLTETLTDASPYNISINNGQNRIISSNTRFGSIEVKNGGTLTFQLNGGDLLVMADYMDLRGTLAIAGTGTLKLYINNGPAAPDLDMTGDIHMAAGLGADSFVIFGGEGTYIRLPGHSSFTGFIYAPRSTVDLNGTPGFTGSIIANTVTGVGTSDVTYADGAADEIDPEDLELIRFTRGLWENN